MHNFRLNFKKYDYMKIKEEINEILFDICFHFEIQTEIFYCLKLCLGNKINNFKTNN
jgi:hypothetical protein